MEDEGHDTDHLRHPGGGAIIFGKYEIGRLLGQGTFAKVYEARKIDTSQKVAIKIIPKDGDETAGGGGSFVRQIIREISVMQLVRHPNVVVLKEVMATKQKIFVVMEHVLGGELFAKVAAGRLTEGLARRYFQQLISAVDFCHSRGVSHRDLKPENLLLDGDGNLKVTDFGLSALPENLRLDGLLHTQCGTPAYVAPEVLRKRGYDGAKADVWSCGVILYVLLAGFLPFNDSNMMRMYTKIYRADFKFPPWISLESRRFISTLLVADPEKRIRIAEIMRTPWFRSPIEGSNHRTEDQINDSDPAKSKKLTSPPFFNAFEFITSMSSGFDLSSLFENRRKSGSLFTSKFSAPTIMEKLESVAKTLNFRVLRSKDYQVRMQGMMEGKKGKLAVTADVSEVSPEVSVVEFSMTAGDTLEYRKFCEDDVRPGLKDIVWSWQWEDNPTQG